MTIRRMALLAAMGCAAAACGSGQAPRHPAESPVTAISPSATSTSTALPQGGLPDFRKVDQGNPTAVSKTVITVMWTVDATVDNGQRDAYLRAVPLLATTYAATISNQPAGGLPATWRDHRAYARVQAVLEEPKGDVEPDTPTTAHRQWQITVTPIGRDGWKGALVHASAFVTLTRAAANAPWRVSNVTTA